MTPEERKELHRQAKIYGDTAFHLQKIIEKLNGQQRIAYAKFLEVAKKLR